VSKELVQVGGAQFTCLQDPFDHEGDEIILEVDKVNSAIVPSLIALNPQDPCPRALHIPRPHEALDCGCCLLDTCLGPPPQMAIKKIMEDKRMLFAIAPLPIEFTLVVHHFQSRRVVFSCKNKSTEGAVMVMPKGMPSSLLESSSSIYTMGSCWLCRNGQ
jgi:hypothetical protein